MARLLALFFPSWKLFDRIEDPLLLEVRKHGEKQWKNALPSLERAWHTLLFNPAGNLKHASQSLLERLAQSLQHASPDTLAQTSDYRRVRALAKEYGGDNVIQFRILHGAHELLISEEFE